MNTAQPTQHPPFLNTLRIASQFLEEYQDFQAVNTVDEEQRIQGVDSQKK